MTIASTDNAFLAELRAAGELIFANRLADAELKVKALARSHGDRHETHNLLGLYAATKVNRIDAMKHFEKAVELAPDNAIYWQNLGKAYLELDLLEKSLPAFGRALKLDPRLFEALWNAGEMFRKIGRADTGLKYLNAALELKPRHLEALASRGASLSALGRIAEAEAHYRKMLEWNVDAAGVYFHLARLKKYKAGDTLFVEIRETLATPTLSADGRSALHFALGKVHEDTGDWDTAFENYASARSLEDRNFDLLRHRKVIDSLIAVFTREYFAARRDVGSGDKRPVFIVGMPRSGTTLTEQISASHSLAHGAGEQLRIQKIANLMGFSQTDFDVFCTNATKAVASDFAQLAAGYQGMMDFLSSKAERIIDKMPHNFLHVGLIAVLFPNARLVHCTRNPIDNCVSIFTNRFNEGHAYARDLTTLGHYFREYRRLMEHWKSVLPIPIFEMSYEETTRDLEGQSRRLIEFIGLHWDPACLNFNKNEATVQTLSNWQVRQPIYKSSVERWRKYEKHLEPLIDALGELAPLRRAAAN